MRKYFSVLAALFALFANAVLAADLPTSPCQLPGVARAARCGVLEVLENPDRPDGRKLPIHVAVVPASSGKALSDPIVVLMGGPGEDAISAAEIYAAQFAPLLKDRDLLLVDQRGTGSSAPLNCNLFSPETAVDSLRNFFPIAAIKACRIWAGRSAITNVRSPYVASNRSEPA